MKKTLILASLIAFSMTTALAAEPTVKVDTPTKTEIQKPAPEFGQKPPKRPDFQKKQAEFDKRLNLTDKQKQKIKDLRIKGHEEMQPIMEQIKTKRQEAEAVKRSKMSVEMQQEKLKQINSEIQDLRKQAHELRMKNMQDFESILTKKQKKELDKIKKEGRKRYEQEHKRNHLGPQKPIIE